MPLVVMKSPDWTTKFFMQTVYEDQGRPEIADGLQTCESWGCAWELSLVMLKFTKRSLRVEMLGSVCGLSNPII
jgi:hypothetical protein